MHYRPLYYKNNKLHLLDQKAIPWKTTQRVCDTAKDVATSITDMTIRGAPLIGQAACWGLYLDLRRCDDLKRWDKVWIAAFTILKNSRPTAVNLVAAMENMGTLINDASLSISQRLDLMHKTLIEQEKTWIDITDRMAKNAARLLSKGSTVLTHCNTGRLATVGRGTALAAIEEGFLQGKVRHVYATETRPYMQGSRLTMWELKQMKIPATLITDSMVSYLMATHKIDAVLTGCDRVALNGDTANKIGTLNLAIAARYFNIPFYIVGPKENIDPRAHTGAQIPIEERSSDEVVKIAGKQMSPKGTKAWHPAFDVTPHTLITSIVTEECVWDPKSDAYPTPNGKVPA